MVSSTPVLHEPEVAAPLASPAGARRDAASGAPAPRRQHWALLRNAQGAIGVAIVLLLTLAAAAAPLLMPVDPGRPVLDRTLQPPSVSAPFGTDELGRDVLGRIVHGGRVSMQVALLAVGMSLAVGVPLGLLAGYRGGRTDAVVMRLMDALYAFPAILLAISIAAAMGPGLSNAVVAIGVVGIPGFARIARSQALQVKALEFVHAARALGATDGRIVWRHVLPNGLAPIIVTTATSSASAILTEASLSFVGLAATPPTPSWGGMLQAGYPFAEQAWWLSVFPGLAIAVGTLGFTFLGDGLRDVLDPKLRGR